MQCFRNVLVFSFVLLSAAAIAQGDLGSLFMPRPAEAQTQLYTTLRVFSTEDASRTDASLGLTEYDLGISIPVMDGPRGTLRVGLDVYGLDLDDDRSRWRRAHFPSGLQDVSASLTYSGQLDRGWGIGGSLRVGSASDDLFEDNDGLYLRGTAFLRIPDEQNAWLVLLHGDTRRDWPVFPGFGYHWNFESGHHLVLGLPFFGAGGPLSQRLRFEATYFPIRNVHTALRYAMTSNVTPYLAFNWGTHQFRLSDDENDADHLRFEDKRIAAGVAVALGEHVHLDVEAGYAFGRRFSVDDDWNFDGHRSTNLEDVGFLGTSLRLRF